MTTRAGGPGEGRGEGSTREDRRHLRRAVELGRGGWGRVHPNPMVGCVIVLEGEVVGEGWHREHGGPHAEVLALEAAGKRARGATAYVSLEPCRHEGKTPPCTRALIEAGVSRVVFGAADPGRRSGGGGAELAAAGIRVDGPLLGPAEARRENPVFFHDDPERPWTGLKLALSLDAKIAARPGERTTISGPEASREVHRLRAGVDAILVGTNTAVVDDPRLTVRGLIEPRVPPVRVILDAGGRISPGARVFLEGDAPAWVITAAGAPDRWRSGIEAAGARVLEVARDEAGGLDLREVMRRLREEGIRSVLCEGGGILASALLAREFVDRMDLVLSPRFLGPEGVAAFPGVGASPGPGELDRIGHDPAWHPDPPRALGPDVWITLHREA